MESITFNEETRAFFDPVLSRNIALEDMISKLSLTLPEPPSTIVTDEEEEGYIKITDHSNHKTIHVGCSCCEEKKKKENPYNYSDVLLEALKEEGISPMEFEKERKQEILGNKSGITLKNIKKMLSSNMDQDLTVPFHPRTRKERQIENKIKQQLETVKNESDLKKAKALIDLNTKPTKAPKTPTPQKKV